MNSKSIFQLSLILAAVSVTSGCLSLPSLPTSFNIFASDDNDLELNTSDDDDKFSTRISSKSDMVTTVREKEKLQRYLESQEAELSKLRGQVRKVLSMEQDLAFILEQFDGNNMDSFSSNGNAVPLQNDFVTASEVAQFRGAQTDNSTNSGLNAIQALEQLNSPAVTGAAAPVNNRLLQAGNGANQNKFSGSAPVGSSPVVGARDTAANSQVSDAKFGGNSNSRFANANTPAQNNVQGASRDKFSNNDIRQAQSIADMSCEANDTLGANSSSYAIHLASYTNTDNIQPGLQKLRSSFKQPLCGKSAIVKNTTVNQKEYLSLRFGPFANRQMALTTCQTLQKDSQYCSVTTFEGTPAARL